MITEIGIIAGEIWHYLDTHGDDIAFSQIVKELQQPDTLVLMSLGWLAREGHVIVRQDGGELRVTLRR
jgi:hypothetical protein